MSGLDEILGRLGGVAIPLRVGGNPKDDADGVCKLAHDVQVQRLTDYLQRFTAANPYNPGDIVTPRAEAPYRAHGAPFIVVETFAPYRHLSEQSSKADFGRTYTMRVARLVEGSPGEQSIMSWEAHHADYERFLPGDRDAGEA
jgi:hypothetical protein